MAASIEPAATCSAAKDEALHQRCDIGVPCDGAAKYFSEPLAVSEIGPPIEIPPS